MNVIIAQDGWQWLVIQVPEDVPVFVRGRWPATVLGRWSNRETAEREACAWLDLAEAAP